MRKHRIAAIGGDGIGPEVISAGLEVLQALAKADGSFAFEVEHFPWRAPALAAPDADTLLLDDLEERIRRLNTGELRFLPAAPDRPVHHHLTRVEITPEALESGWVVLHQCHDQLDQVPATQIVYRPGTLRRLEIVGYRNIESAWVEGDSVQLQNVAADAQLCVAVATRALHRTGEREWELRNGPFMRGFLDGYFPMRVSLEVKHPDGLELVGTDPPAQPGFEVRDAAPWVTMNCAT